MTLYDALTKLSPSHSISGGTDVSSSMGESISFGNNSASNWYPRRRRGTTVIIIIRNDRRGYPQSIPMDQPMQ